MPHRAAVAVQRTAMLGWILGGGKADKEGYVAAAGMVDEIFYHRRLILQALPRGGERGGAR